VHPLRPKLGSAPDAGGAAAAPGNTGPLVPNDPVSLL